MDRRRFIVGSTATSCLMALGWFTGARAARGGPLDSLAESLCPLFDSRFKAAATERSFKELLRTLRAKKVISASNVLNANRIAELAPSDEIKRYNHFYFTSTELEVYALAYKVGVDSPLRRGKTLACPKTG